nr:protein-L-isoaspartate O-methyltransferase [Pseudomonadota bacterium]
ERALVIGAATGYSAGLLDRLVRSVVAVEEVPELADFARRALAGTGVEVVQAPLAQGHAPGAPYDFILIDGAVEYVPQVIVEQLADGGEFALALIEEGIRGVSRLCVGRVVAGAFGTSAFADVAAAVLPGFVKPRGFSF